MLMSCNPGAAAFGDVRSIVGLTNGVNRKLSQKVRKLLNDALGVPENRVYLNFTEVETGDWGWNGSMFG